MTGTSAGARKAARTREQGKSSHSSGSHKNQSHSKSNQKHASSRDSK